MKKISKSDETSLRSDLNHLKQLIAEVESMLDRGLVQEELDQNHDHACMKIFRALRTEKPMFIGPFAVLKID